jgi:hypothetical protein
MPKALIAPYKGAGDLHTGDRTWREVDHRPAQRGEFYVSYENGGVTVRRANMNHNSESVIVELVDSGPEREREERLNRLNWLAAYDQA